MQPIRTNVLLLSFIAALVIVLLAAIFPTEAVAVIALGGGLIGAIGGVMRELVSPPPDRPEAPPVTVQLEAYQELAAVTRSAVSAQPPGIAMERVVLTREGEAPPDEPGG